MSRLKYMGAADRRVFRQGEDFQGRLNTPLPRDVVLDWSNRHVIDSDDHTDLPAGFFDLLAQEPGFQDVSGHDVIPLNDAERLWKGQRDPHDTRYARPEGEGMPVFNPDFPTKLSPPPDQELRPVGAEPNDDLDPDTLSAMEQQEQGGAQDQGTTDDDAATDTTAGTSVVDAV